MKIYQQTNSQGFFIGTSAHGEDWAGAIDTDAPEYNPSTHKARWVEDAWDIRTIAEWDEILNPVEEGEE